MIDKSLLMKTTLDLVAVPSISGTPSENLAAQKIYDILIDIPYFKSNPDNLKKIDLVDDPYGRCFVSALFRSKFNTDKTIILTGHFDVVGIEEYGHLKEYAFNPVEYTKRVSELYLDDDAKEDLESGDWLFGRGIADMKFGLALLIELIRDISQREDFRGNILFLAVPGEESNSEGMLAAVTHLVDLQDDMGLKYVGLFLPEPYDDTDKRLIYTGTCGKIMPMFFFAGKETHVGEPFSGLNPILIASELNKLMELDTDFCDVVGTNVAPPPACLKFTDLKELYSVTTPLYAASYYNLITFNTTIDVLMEKLKRLSEEAFRNALNIVKKNKSTYEKYTGINVKHDIAPCIVTYEELYNDVKKIYGDKFDDYLNQKVKSWQNDGHDLQTISINIIKELYEKYPNKKPMIIISFVPPYYPHRFPDDESDAARNALKITDDIITFAAENLNEFFKKEDYFTGICDLSYTGIKEPNINEVFKNMPGYGITYKLPLNSLEKLNVYGIVLGPYSKDIHKYTERLNISYSFDILPIIYEYAINRIIM